jgi:hypothetical protein
MNDRPASKRLKITSKYSGQITIHNNKFSKTMQHNVSLLDCINMKEDKVKFHQLVFDQDVLQFLSSDHPGSVSRKIQLKIK